MIEDEHRNDNNINYNNVIILKIYKYQRINRKKRRRESIDNTFILPLLIY